MTIEQQGYVEVQPQYQHVGYTVAALQRTYLQSERESVSLGALGAAVVTLALGLIICRRAGARRPVLFGAGLLCSAIAITLGATVFTLRAEVWRLRPETARTLSNIERASALTDAWIAELGRPPTETEWQERIGDRACANDAWGRPLIYTRLLTPSPRDGRSYEISGDPRWCPEGPPREDPDWKLSSSQLGRDGIFGTPDDKDMFPHNGGDWTDPTRYTHGRTPRETATQ